ncbi:MAG: FG-GAP repeat protein [Deltaproteobacteria bacterium]|nr:FG-GAP repeat protein [Deltaproteobacteria bacterium]
MAHRIRLGLLLPFIASAAVGCSDDPVPPPVDAGADVSDTGADTGTDAGTDVGTDSGMCPSVEFIRPTSSAVLGVADDMDNNCSNGFAYGVQIATNAPIGSRLELLVNGRSVGNTTVSGPTVRFEGVQFDTGAMSTLEIRRSGSSVTCGTATVSVDCNVPRCSITAPARSTLNLTDSTAGAGMPFATGFVVGTDIEDGREVELSITGTATPLRAAVMSGTARFNNVRLSPDGEFVTRATCTNRAGNVGRSAESRFTVDSVAPNLTVQSPMANAVIGLSGDVNAAVPGVQFNVCARSDAAGRRVCASVMGSTPADPAGCADVPASATTDACVQVTCPDGNAPFTVEVSTQDAAGNVARGSIANVRCQSALPSVRIVSPAAYSAGDATTILNAARDANPAVVGMQVDVVACTDRSSGAAVLTRDTVTTPVGMATVMPTAAGDPCAALGMGFVGIARFPGVTLPESFPVRTSPTSPAPTNPALQVAVTDAAGDRGSSAPTVLYVDSAAPTLNIFNCNRILRPAVGATSARTNVVVTSDAYPLTLTLTRTGDMPRTIELLVPGGAGGTSTFENLEFFAGTTTLRLAATDPAGNASATNGMCTIDVGNPPMLAFTSPAPGATFRLGTTSVTLSTDAPNGTVVSLRINGGTALTAAATNGSVTFASVMLPDGDAVALTASTADVPGRGVGMASVTVVVDTGVPTAPTALMAAIPATPRSARRAGTLRLTWADGSDPSPTGTGTRAVARYEVRTSTVPFTPTNFPGGTLAVLTTTPGVPGAPNTADISGLQLGRSYYVAIRSFDVAGNVSPTVATAGPVPPDIIVDQIANPVPPLGSTVSGGQDFNMDGFADLVVGSGSSMTSVGGYARIYFGSATGISATNFTEFRGGASDGRFGTAVVALGDINMDGIADLAISEPGPTTAGATRPGIVYIYFGRPSAMWRRGAEIYLPTEANVIISGGTGDFATARLGASLARVGDFDGDSINDVAIGAPNATGGGAVVVFRGRATWPAYDPHAQHGRARHSQHHPGCFFRHHPGWCGQGAGWRYPRGPCDRKWFVDHPESNLRFRGSLPGYSAGAWFRRRELPPGGRGGRERRGGAGIHRRTGTVPGWRRGRRQWRRPRRHRHRHLRRHGRPGRGLSLSGLSLGRARPWSDHPVDRAGGLNDAFGRSIASIYDPRSPIPRSSRALRRRPICWCRALRTTPAIHRGFTSTGDGPTPPGLARPPTPPIASWPWSAAARRSRSPAPLDR